MFSWFTFRRKSLAEKTLEAMEKRQSQMTPTQLAEAEAAFRKITEEVRASRASADETRSGETRVSS